ncbi:MAG TPA: DUF4157 domain-containing protein [Myxococcales bacterium]|jgi:hypothetical protein|nr:DUF4157 domain-containing protein [Myxococcales bacterium]
MQALTSAIKPGVAGPSQQARAPIAVQRKCTSCEEREDEGRSAQRSARGAASPAADSAGVDAALSSPGQPLDAQTRAFMENRLAYDFGQVRVHADGQAAESARAMSAVAYTVGRDLVFDSGAYAPRSSTGLQLIAHELTHVVQQARGPVAGRATAAGLTVSEPGDAHERQADAVAASLFGNHGAGRDPRPLPSSAGSAVQRQARRGGATPTAARVPTLVEDGAQVGAGQMRRTDFLAAVHAAVSDRVEAEFRRVGRPGRDCPYILRTIERYRGRPLSALMRFVAAFAQSAPGTTARGVVDAMAARAGIIARRIASRENPRAQAQTESGGALPAHEPAAMRAQLGAGRALDDGARHKMERSYGSSFGAVRVHDDATAARLNTALGARAFTIGRDIAFAPGQYRPGTTTGDLLIAHELAHTIQQGSAASGGVAGPGQELEDQADRAARAAVGGRERAAATLVDRAVGPRIQRAPALLAGAIIVAEATPEVIVVAEVATVSTEVVVVDGALVAADVAAPTILEVTAPAALEAAAPVASTTVAPVVASSSAFSTTAAAVGLGAVSTLSSDSPTSEEPEQRRRRCQEANPTALACEGSFIDRDEAAVDFLFNQGFDFGDLGECHGVSSFGSGVINACSGAPGQSWHCQVRGSDVPLSIFGCLCCEADGTTSYEWLGPHWSDNQSRRGRR